MESCSNQHCKAKISELEQENIQLQKELAVKNVISEISQLEIKQEDPECIYQRIFLILSEIISIDNFYIVLEENGFIQIPFIVDQNDQLSTELLREDKNPDLRYGLTGYAIEKGTSIVLNKNEIEQLKEKENVKMIGSLPKQWLFHPFYADNIKGGIVVQSYVKDDGYSYNDMSILAYVTMHVGNFLSAYQSKTKIQEQIEELKAAQNQLVQSEKMASVGQLAAGVAHEINNPLGYVNSNLNSLREYIEDFASFSEEMDDLAKTSDDSASQIEIEVLKQNINELKEKHDVSFILSDTNELIKECLFGMDKVKKIIQSLKNFSHAGEDKREITDINECIKEAIIIVWNELKYHCELKTNYGKLPKTFCYPSKLNQVFMNLLINAGHATQEKGIITVTTSCKKDMILISIRDNGKGIEEQHLSQLFNPFFTTKPVGQGTGLGLSISYGIIENHGGKIDVESTVGEGSCFNIYLPLLEKQNDS